MSTEEEIFKNSKEIYLLCFGNMYLHPKDIDLEKIEHYYQVIPWAAIPKEIDYHPYKIEDVIECFKPSPKVNSINLIRKESVKWKSIVLEPVFHWFFSPLLKITLKIPIKNQLYTTHMIQNFGKRVEAIDEFNVFYDGCNFLIYSRIKNYNKIFPGPRDIRDFLEESLQKKFNVETIPPCPLRENYIIFILDEKFNIKNYDKTFRSRTRSKNTYILLKEDELEDIDLYIERLFTNSHMFLDCFYACKNILDGLETYGTKMHRVNLQTIEILKTYKSTKSYHILKRLGLKNELENKILDFYKSLCEYNICLTLIQEGREDFKKDIQEYDLFNLNKDIYMSEFEYRDINIDLLQNNIKYIENIIEKSFSWRLLFTSAIIAALTSILIKFGPTIIKYLFSFSQ